MKRQAMQITPEELLKIAVERVTELKENNGMEIADAFKQRCIFNIINKTEASDTWEFER